VDGETPKKDNHEPSLEATRKPSISNTTTDTSSTSSAENNLLHSNSVSDLPSEASFSSSSSSSSTTTMIQQQSKPKLEQTESPQTEQSAETEESLELKSGISAMMARKLLKRIKLLSDIKNKMLTNPNLEELLKKAELLDMPSWWLIPEHDLSLLQYVIRFGIGTKKWEAFIESKDCTFYKMKEGKVEFKKQKFRFLKEFIKEKPPLLRRLEYLRLVVLEPTAVAEEFGKRRRTPEIMPRYLFTRSSRHLEDHEGRGEALEADTELYEPIKLNMNLKQTTREISRDAEGKPILPILAKGSTITELGIVVYDRPAYHSRNYIWPVGFKSTRKLPSIKNIGETTLYISEVVDGGSSPLFRITAMDYPELVLQHATSSGVWVEALKLIKKRPNISVSGPEMFGFSDPTVKMLIQELPNARKCLNYIWKDFDFGSPVSPPIASNLAENRVDHPSNNAISNNGSPAKTSLSSNVDLALISTSHEKEKLEAMTNERPPSVIGQQDLEAENRKRDHIEIGKGSNSSNGTEVEPHQNKQSEMDTTCFSR